MAHIIPEGWRELEALGAARREIETLAVLQAALPDSYTIYHGVHWTRIERGHAIFGEIDFAIVNPAGQLLLIEQKSGFLNETPDGLVKHYGQREKNVPVQLARNADALHTRFSTAFRDTPLRLDTLLYCPDYHVQHPATAGLDASRIVDAGRRDQLAAIIRAILPDTAGATPTTARLHRFLADQLDLVPDVSALIGRAGTMVTRLSGGLATWARRLEFAPFRLRVVGTAGSGKTQLALAVFGDAVAAGRRPLYVCYNRPLADHVAALVPPGGEVATWHQLCDRHARSQGVTPDFSDPQCFAQLEARFASAAIDDAWRFDTVIVDEGQDFSPAWRDALLRLLDPSRDDGQAWWLEDPLQNLYGRAPVALPGWVVLRSDTNYRSPRDVLDLLNNLPGAGAPVRAGSPLLGAGVEWVEYRDTAGMTDASKRAITHCLGLGYKRRDIALLSFRGREGSRLMSYTQLGAHSLKTFSGAYDLFGNPVYNDGEVLCETVYRFKGQSAPCVIFTEVDFDVLDDLALRKLFVGTTRATMKLMIVCSERAARLMRGTA